MWFMLLVKSASIPEDSHLLSLLRKFVKQNCSNDVILIVRASPRVEKAWSCYMNPVIQCYPTCPMILFQVRRNMAQVSSNLPCAFTLFSLSAPLRIVFHHISQSHIISYLSSRESIKHLPFKWIQLRIARLAPSFPNTLEYSNCQKPLSCLLWRWRTTTHGSQRPSLLECLVRLKVHSIW